MSAATNRMNEKIYDELYNEGEEGFNPYRQQKESNEPMWSKIESRISKLQRLLNGMSDEINSRRERYESEIETLYKIFEEIKPF